MDVLCSADDKCDKFYGCFKCGTWCYVQSYWEVPCIAHFCSLYREKFDLLDFDIEELEEALLTDSSDEEIGNLLIQDLIVRLLKGCFRSFNSQQKDDITSFNYQMYLRRLFRVKCEKDSSRHNPFNRDIAFHSLPLRNRVELLHDLCNFRLEADEIPDPESILEADSLRVRPLGKDSGGSTYWYFYGTRLYREDYYTKTKSCPPKKRGKKSGGRSESTVTESKWEIACSTEEDWQLLTNKFKNCKNKDEKALYERLRDNFLPELPRLFAEREKLMSKRMMDQQPRRSNRVGATTAITIPRSPSPTPAYPPQKSSSVLFDELQTMKQIEESEAKKKVEDKPSSRKSGDTESVLIEPKLSEAELSQKQREEQEKADRLFAEQLEREERMARLHLRERRLSGAGGRSRSSGNEYSLATAIRESKPKRDKSSQKKRENSNSPSRSSSADKKKNTRSSKHNKKVKKLNNKSRMTNNSLSASLSGGSDDVDENSSGSGKEEEEEDEKEQATSESDSETETESKKKKKIISKKGSKTEEDDIPSKKDIRKRVFSGSSRKHKDNNTIQPKTKNLENETDTKSALNKSSKKSGANNSTKNSSSGFGLGTSKTKVKSSYLFSQNEEDVVIGMHKVIEAVKSHPDAWPFANPVDEAYAPGYYSRVKDPMDLQTMENKLDNKKYHSSVVDFKSDFQKIVDNCRLYNGAGNEYTQMVETLEEAFNKNIQRFMIQDESDDEEISIEYANLDATGSGHKKKKKPSPSANIKSKNEVKTKKSQSQTPVVESSQKEPKEPGKEKHKSTQDKAKKESTGSTKSKEIEPSTSSTKVKDNKNSRKELLMRHHSHKSDKDGKKVVSATAEALKDMNKWLDETIVGIPIKKKKKKDKRLRDTEDASSVRSSSSDKSDASMKVHKSSKERRDSINDSALTIESHSSSSMDGLSKKKKLAKSGDKDSKLSSSRDGDDKFKPVKKRHRHHSGQQKNSPSSIATSKREIMEKDHHHHHHHHHHRHHSHSSASGNTDRESNTDVVSGSKSAKTSSFPPKKRDADTGTSVGTKRRKLNSTSSPSSPPSKKSGKAVKKDGDAAEKNVTAVPLKEPSSVSVSPSKRKSIDNTIKPIARKPLMKRSMSLLQGFKQSGSMKRLQIGKATKFNIKHSTSTSFDSDNSKDNSNGAGKIDFLPPWKRAVSKVLCLDSSGNTMNRTLSAPAGSELAKWQQQERNSDSRFSWLKSKKEGGGPKLSLGTVLPKHAINLSGLQYNENGLSDNEQNGSTHEDEEEEDDDDEDLYAKLARGLANLSRGRLSDKTRELIAANPAIAARIALGGIEKVKEDLDPDKKKGEEPAAASKSADDRKLEPAKGFNAEKSLPNLSAWFKAFGAPTSSSSSSNTSTAATTPTQVINKEEKDNTSAPVSTPTTPSASTTIKPKFRVMGRTPGGNEKKGTPSMKACVDTSNVKGEQQLSISGGITTTHSPPTGKIEDTIVKDVAEPKPVHASNRNRKVSTSSMSSQSEMGSPAVYYGGTGGNQESGGLVINPPRWTDSTMEQHNWGSQSQSPSASSQVSSQSPAGPNSPFSPAPISSPPETPPRPVGPVRVGFYQDITNSSQHSSPEKAGSNESPQNIINVTSPATPPNTSVLHHPSPTKRDSSGVKGYQAYVPPNYPQRYSVNSNTPSPGPSPRTPGNTANVNSPPSSVEARSDSPPPSNTNKTYTHLEAKQPDGIPPRVMYDPPRWSPYPPGHPLYQHHALPRAHLTAAAAGSPHAELFSPNPPNYNSSEYGQPEAAHSRNNSRYTPNMNSAPQAAHSNSQPQAAHQFSSSSVSSSSSSILRPGNPACLIQSQIPGYSSNPYASNPRSVNIPPNIYNNPIADRLGGSLGMIPMSSSSGNLGSALTLTNSTQASSSSTSTTSTRGKKAHQQQSINESQGKGSSDVGVMNGFQWPHHPMAGLTQIVNNLPNSMNPYITRGHHPHYDPEAMAKYARGGVDPMGYTNLSAAGGAKSSMPHPEQLVAKGLVNLSNNSPSTQSANESQSSTEAPPPEKKRRGRGEGKKTKAAKAEAAAAAAAASQQQQQAQSQQQQQPIVPGSAFNFSSISGGLYPKDIGENPYSSSSPGLPLAHSHHHRSSSEHLYPPSNSNFHQPFVSSARSSSTNSSGTPGPSPSPYSIPPYIGSHPSAYHQSQSSQSSPFGASPRGIVDPYQQFFQPSPHVLPLLPPTSSYAQAYAAAAASTHPSAAHGLGLRPGWNMGI